MSHFERESCVVLKLKEVLRNRDCSLLRDHVILWKLRTLGSTIIRGERLIERLISALSID